MRRPVWRKSSRPSEEAFAGLVTDILVADKVGLGSANARRRLERTLLVVEGRMNDDAAAQRYGDIMGLLVPPCL